MTPNEEAALQAVRAGIRRAKIERLCIVAATLAAFLALWEIVGHLTNPLFFAPISEVIVQFWKQNVDPNQTLLNGFVETLSILVPGFVIAAVLGIALGVLMGRSNVALQILAENLGLSGQLGDRTQGTQGCRLPA